MMKLERTLRVALALARHPMVWLHCLGLINQPGRLGIWTREDTLMPKGVEHIDQYL